MCGPQVEGVGGVRGVEISLAVISRDLRDSVIPIHPPHSYVGLFTCTLDDRSRSQVVAFSST